MSRPPRALLFASLLPLLTVLSGWIAVLMSSDETPPSAADEAPWVRTTDGWERANWLVSKRDCYTPPLHPAPVALGLMAASVIILGVSHARAGHSEKTKRAAIVVACGDRL